ncbi:hypothetical protein Emag_001096 [Eimeria magna]
MGLEEETIGEQQLLQDPPPSARLVALQQQQQQQQADEAAAGAGDLLSGEPHASSLEDKVDEFLDKLCNAGTLSLGNTVAAAAAAAAAAGAAGADEWDVCQLHRRSLLLKQRFFKLHERFVHASLKESRAAARLQRLAQQLTLQQQDLGEAAARTAQHAEQISNLKEELNQQQKNACKHEARELEAQLSAQLHRCIEPHLLSLLLLLLMLMLMSLLLLLLLRVTAARATAGVTVVAAVFVAAAAQSHRN